MAKQEILISIQVKNKSAKAAIDSTSASLDRLSKSQENVAKNTKEAKTQSGLNNAILLESGRLASDASYGFSAMANNLSQLVSLFSSFSQTAGGFGASLKELGKSLVGTGGVLLLVQLLIGALQSEKVQKFLKSLSGLSPVLRELGDLSKNYARNTEQLIGNFDIYTRKLMDSTESEEQKRIALEKLNDEYPDFNASILTSASNTDEASDAIERYIKKLKEQALSQAAITQFQEISGELSKSLFDIELRKAELQEDIARDEALIAEQRAKFGENLRADEKLTLNERISGYIRTIEFNKNQLKMLEEESDEVALQYKNRLDIVDNFIILADDKNKKGVRTLKEFRKQELDFDKQRISMENQTLDEFVKREETKVRKNALTLQQMARDRKNDFDQKQKQRLDDYLKSDATEAQKAEAVKKYNDSIAESEASLLAYIESINENTNAKITNLDIARSRAIQNENRAKLDAEAAYLDEKNRMNGDYSFFQTERNIKTLNSDILAQQAIVDSHAVGTLEREQAEKRLFELKKQLNSEEQAMAEQKFAFFNQQYTSITDALSQTFSVSAENETIALEESYGRRIAAAEGDAEAQERLQEELAKKKDKIARKQFKIDKAMKIGRALMDTYQSAWLAFGSQLVVGDPTSPVRARIAQAVALASGLANVANIARQKYQGSLSAGGGGASGGGGGTQIQAPDFNVVGASQTSQLAQAVTTQQQKPVKAFVVGKDISNTTRT
jgi:hypothetical protein